MHSGDRVRRMPTGFLMRWVSYACMHRGGREGGANYLQVVTKDTLEDQVGLSISLVRLASRGRIQLASLKEIFFLFQMQLFAKCLVIFQLTISILGVFRRQRIPLPTDPNTGTGVISGIGIARSGMRGIGSSNCSKSNNGSSSSSNKGRPELAPSYRKSWTDTRQWYGRYNEEPYIPDTLWRVCHRKKSMCQGGLQIWAWGTTETPPNALTGSGVWGPTWNHCSTK